MVSDLRRYARQTNIRLVLGFLLILFLVGDGLIYLIYGGRAALLGLVCLVAALSPVVIILGGLFLMEWAVRRYRQE